MAVLQKEHSWSDVIQFREIPSQNIGSILTPQIPLEREMTIKYLGNFILKSINDPYE